MCCIGSRAPILLLALGLLAAWSAAADDEQSEAASTDFSEFSPELQTGSELDGGLDWAEVQLPDSRFALADGLRLDWPPALGTGAVPRPNQLASWKPSSGMRVDYSGRDEAVFLRWRLGF